MSDFGLVRPFGIDDGELDGLRPNEIFVLGYECCKIDELLEKPDAICELLHAENIDRIVSQVKRKGRDYHVTFMASDQSESWVQLDVAPVDGPLEIQEPLT